MCTIWASKAQFLGHFGPESKTKFWTLVTFSKSFHWFHISIASHSHCKCFEFIGVWKWASEAQSWGHFGPPNKSKFSFFCFFLIKKISLVSLQYCFTCSLQVLLDVWRIWASDVQFWALWGPKISKNSGHWSFSTGFASVLVYMTI